jgi:hypothetical protein
MRTSGHGNDGLMVLAPIAVAALVLVILGPTKTLDGINDLLSEIVSLAREVINALM